MAQKKSRSQPARAEVSRARDVRSTIRDAELEIIDGVIDIAKKGSYQHAKFLFDYAGLSHQPAPEQDEPSLAQVLLERLGLDRGSAAGTENSSDHGNYAENLVNVGTRS